MPASAPAATLAALPAAVPEDGATRAPLPVPAAAPADPAPTLAPAAGSAAALRRGATPPHPLATPAAVPEDSPAGAFPPASAAAPAAPAPTLAPAARRATATPPRPVSAPDSPVAARLWRLAPLIFLLLWSGGYSFAKLGLQHVEPMTMLVWRYGLAVAVLVPFLLLRRPALPRGARQWGAMALTGLLIQCGYFGLAYLAMTRGMNAGTTAIVMALQPALVAVLAPLLGQRRGGPLLWPGLGLGFAGVVLVVLADGSLGPSPGAAVLLALGALFGMTAATLFEKWHGFRTDPVAGGIVQYVVGFAVLLPVALATESMAVDWQPELIVALAYLVLANSIVSIGLLIALIQRGDATRISTLMYLVPPLAMLLAWAILGEPMGPLAFAGLGLSAAGVWLVTRATG